MTAIRSLSVADHAARRVLWRAYLALHGAERPEEGYAASFSWLDNRHGLIANFGLRPIGPPHYTPHRHGWHVAQDCHLRDLDVVPPSRGTGAGRALVDAVYAAADATGAAEVYRLTLAFNAEARRLYDRVGAVTPFIKCRR